MKFFLAFILLPAWYMAAKAQHADKLMIYDTGELTIFTDSGYVAIFTGNEFPFYRQLRCTIKKQGSDQVVEDFSWYSDSCFAYIQYNNDQNTIAKGLVCISPGRKYYDTLQIPDIEKDPDLSRGIMKDFIFSYSYFDKVGLWEETESPIVTRQGTYEAGKKTGIWKVGVYQFNHHPSPGASTKNVFIVKHTEQYKDGTIDKGYCPDFSLKAIWEKLKGPWFLSYYNSIYSVQYMYAKKPVESTDSFSFMDSSYFRKNDKKIPWKLKDGVIYMYFKDESRKYRIAYLSANELYLTPLPAEPGVKKGKKKK